YYTKFRHNTAKLNCSCGRVKTPKHMLFYRKTRCCTLAGLSLHFLFLYIYILSFVHSYTINLVLHSPSISHT
ncbi:hypothetical protein BDW02DRAFT_607070, partial [Decorospora gaudefroyi]